MESAQDIVLLVEDNEEIRATFKLGLELEGFAVQEAGNGLEALESIRRNTAPSIIILDMLMPKMNGLEFVTELRKNSNAKIASIPVIAVTATSERFHQEMAEIQDTLRKPIELEELYGIVRSWISKNKN